MGRYNKYDEREKEHRKLNKRLRELYTVQRSDFWEDLPKPRKYGWIKELVLTNDVLRRKDWQIYQEVLEACKVYTWANTKEQLDKRWLVVYKNKKPQKPGMKVIKSKEFNKLSSAAKKFFVKRDSKGWYRDEKYVYDCLLPRIFFGEKYSRAFVFRVRKINSEVEREIAQIENRMEHEFYDLEQKRFAFGKEFFRRKKCITHNNKVNKAILEFTRTGEVNEIIYQDYKMGW